MARPGSQQIAGYYPTPTALLPSIAAFRPWEGTPTGVAHSAHDLLGARFETAVPPKPRPHRPRPLLRSIRGEPV